MTTNVKLKLIGDALIDNAEPGVGKYYIHGGDEEGHPPRGLMFICPKCLGLGSVAFPAWTWDGNIEEPTVTPSILHNKTKCGWHGYLTKGEFVPC